MSKANPKSIFGKSKPVKPQESDPAADFPLFFKRPVPLDPQRHGKAGVTPTQEVSFAANTNSILISTVEFIEAAKHYPIVFTQAEPHLPAAILGLERENYFVSTEGKWQEGAYVPAYVRRYPFVFMSVPEEKKFVLCIDEAAPQYARDGGKDTQPLYNGDKPSKLTLNALEFCTAFQNHHQLTRRFCEALQEAELLTPSQSNAKLFNGRQINLGGFQVIDEKKLARLPEEKIVEFHKNGWLPLIYFAIMSTSNWKKLADMAASRDSGSKKT